VFARCRGGTRDRDFCGVDQIVEIMMWLSTMGTNMVGGL